MAHRVLGVDGCKGGWVGVVLDGRDASACFGATIAALVSAAESAGAVEVVAIDIPIGLSDTGRRQADVQAARAIGLRRSSVFMTPIRRALEAADHATASRIHREVVGVGISQQAYALRVKILEVDAWVRTEKHRVVEVHPEVSFARMAEKFLDHRKATWAGVEQRRELLAAEGIALTGDLGLAGKMAGVDDVLDAAAAAWSARRVAAGTAASLPSPPEDLNGWPCAIWV